ncbi:MAG: MerR family transcriptional regulator [Megasphaera sp.]|jgi:DNA-binding transcriptional MerR regulator|nr:MerR family transcriptional regulator [Megasphaera sp.]
MFIREMAKRTGVSEDTLRYYERIGIMPAVPRNTGGIRNYAEYHVQYMALVNSLKSSGMTLEDIQQYMELARQGVHTEGIRKNMIRVAKQGLLCKIENLQQAVMEADYQISHYETSLLYRTNLMAQGFRQG